MKSFSDPPVRTPAHAGARLGRGGAAFLSLALVATLGLLSAQLRPKSDALPEDVKEILRHMSLVMMGDGQGGQIKTIRFTGVNVQIVNGLEATNGDPAFPFAPDGVTNGAGNLIVGYGETPGGFIDRTGSHCIVVGQGHTYSSFGGIVGGLRNKITGANASALAGALNEARGNGACVVGGWINWATGTNASVLGGVRSAAQGDLATVSGGYKSIASGSCSSVSGGNNSRAVGGCSSVCGGIFRSADLNNSWVAGGLFEQN